jgi:hypothetical protein
MTILYPVAPDVTAALAAPQGRAAREREAQALAGEGVAFVSETTGPAHPSREAALAAYGGRLEAGAEDAYCRLVEVLEGPPPKPQRPNYKDGRRWPTPPKPPKTAWRLQVSYWRPVSAAPAATAVAGQARETRRRAGGPLDSEALRELTRQPLQPVQPQQPLDIGLFEARLPEAPHIVVPDE